MSPVYLIFKSHDLGIQYERRWFTHRTHLSSVTIALVSVCPEEYSHFTVARMRSNMAPATVYRSVRQREGRAAHHTYEETHVARNTLRTWPIAWKECHHAHRARKTSGEGQGHQNQWLPCRLS